MKVIRATSYRSILFIFLISFLHLSCDTSEENQTSSVLERMQFELHHSHSKFLYQEGTGSYISLRAELGANEVRNQNNEYNKLIQTLELMLHKMEEIEEFTLELTEFIHKKKKNIVTKLGCPNALGSFDPKDPHPALINGSKLKGNQEDIFNANELEKKIIKYRNALILGVANSRVTRKKGIGLSFDTPFDPILLKHIPENREGLDLKKLRKILTAANIDDRDGLEELILVLTPQADENRIYDARDALHYLSILEGRIFKARKIAFYLFDLRTTFCGPTFDKIVPVVSGPNVVEKGDEIELQLMIAALDSYNDPEVTCAQNASIEARDGVVYLTMNVDKTTTLKGTIGIKNKQGAMKTQEWEKTITVK